MAEHVDYEVTVHVPNQHVDGSYDRVHEIAKPTFGSNVPSVDDAKRICNCICPSGNAGRMICYDFPEGQHQAILDYKKDKWPLPMIQFKSTNGGNGPTPPTPPSGKHTGLHLQHMEAGWWKLYDAGCSFAKVFSAEDVLGIFRHNPSANVVVRNYVPNQEPYYNTSDPYAAGERWVDNVRDTLHAVCNQIAHEFPHRPEPYFSFESANEEYNADNKPKNIQIRDLDIGVAWALERSQLPIAAAVMCAAVGNPHESQFYMLVEMADAFKTLRFAPWWGYHDYFIWNGSYGGPSHLWQYLAGRGVEIDKVLRDAGHIVPWYGGESGAIRGFSSPPEPFEQIAQWESYAETAIWDAGDIKRPAVQIIRFPLPSHEATIFQQSEGWVTFFPNDGWRHPGVYNGVWAPHQLHLNELETLLGDDHLGNAVFTSCPYHSGWDDFWVKDPEIVAMANA